MNRAGRRTVPAPARPAMLRPLLSLRMRSAGMTVLYRLAWNDPNSSRSAVSRAMKACERGKPAERLAPAR